MTENIIDAKFERCFVVDRSLSCEDEGANNEEKSAHLLYFHPQDTEVEEQIRHVSLCLGLIDFSKTFDDDETCETVEMTDEIWVIRNPEPDIWYVMVVSLPRRESGKSSQNNVTKKKQHPRGIRSIKKEERKGEALTGSLEPAVLHSVLKDMHEAFVLFHGSIREAIHPGGNTTETDVIARTRKRLRKAVKIRDGLENDHITSTPERLDKAKEIPVLKQKLEKIVRSSRLTKIRSRMRSALSAYLRSVCFERLHLFESIRGFNFLPVNRITYLSTQYFVNLLRDKFSDSILSVTFLYDGRVLSTDMHPNLMRVVYNAIRRRVFRDAIETSRRMSLPFVLAPNGSLFSRTIYDFATKKTPAEWRRRRRCSGVLNDLVDVSDEEKEDEISIIRDVEMSNELNRIANQSRAEILSSRMSDEDADKDKGGEQQHHHQTKKKKRAMTNRNTNDPIGRMLLFQESGVMLVLVVKLDTLKGESDSPSKLPYFCSKFVDQIKPEVRKLGKVVAEQYKKMRGIEEVRRKKIRYVYFNRMNFALKTEGIKKPRKYQASKNESNGAKNHIPSSSSELAKSLSREVLQALDGTHSSFTQYKDDEDDDSDFDQVREIYTKTSSNGWVVGRSAADRYFYTLLNHKSAENLEDASNLIESATKALFFNIRN